MNAHEQIEDMVAKVLLGENNEAKLIFSQIMANRASNAMEFMKQDVMEEQFNESETKQADQAEEIDESIADLSKMNVKTLQSIHATLKHSAETLKKPGARESANRVAQHLQKTHGIKVGLVS